MTAVAAETDGRMSAQPETIFVTHATPQDNEFALWLTSKLAIAGYHVWVDRRRLLGGDDCWDEIDRVLRRETIKQIVVYTKHITKPGVKKELAIGDVSADFTCSQMHICRMTALATRLGVLLGKQRP